ncbi:MAG: hypothetical protein IT521_08525 [Burkholderiales bacterium]|nr:hypothetical protein [Burkholderiales bacterium]
MIQAEDMTVTIRLPLRTLHQGRASRLCGEGRAGGFGLLPNHADFVTELVPSVLTLVLADETELFFGIDEGMLVKRDSEVSVVVRRGVAGDALDTLQRKVRDSFVDVEDDERAARVALSRLEADMVRRLGQLHRLQP